MNPCIFLKYNLEKQMHNAIFKKKNLPLIIIECFPRNLLKSLSDCLIKNEVNSKVSLKASEKFI